MDSFNRKNREETDMDVEFSYSIKAGKRIYYMDVRRTRKDDLYLSITESKKIVPANGDNAAPSFEKHKIFLYREDFSKFIDGLSKAIGYIHENQPVSRSTTAGYVTPENEPEELPDASEGEDDLDDLKISF